MNITESVGIGKGLSVGRDLDVQGNARIGHNLKVEGYLEAPNIKDCNKGVFETYEKLLAAYPNPQAGWFAGVGTTTPFTLYVSEGNGWKEVTGDGMSIEMDMDALNALQESLDALGVRVVTDLANNPEYIWAMTDAEGTVLIAVDKAGKICTQSDETHKGDMRITGSLELGAKAVAALVAALKKEGFDDTGVNMLTENPEYLWALADSNGAILFAARRDGSLLMPGIHTSTIDKNPEFLNVVVDSEGRILETIDRTGRRTTGMKQIFANEVAFKKAMTFNDEAAASLISALEQGGFTPHSHTDWSDAESMQVPLPRCAMLNIIWSGDLKTISKASYYPNADWSGTYYNIPVEVEFSDMQGNYFRKWALMSAQGNSSMAFAKRNLSIDFYNSREDADTDGSAFAMRFGDWVAQTSFHMKAYYTDYFRGVGKVAYDICEAVAQTRPFADQRPYREIYRTDALGDTGITKDAGLRANMDYSPKCFPQGFPVIIMQNGQFWGIFAWQIKKHRDNYMLTKKNARHIHLDGTLGKATIFEGAIDWTAFEVRNPKSLKYLVPQSIHGKVTDKYDGDFPAEIAESETKTCIENFSRYVPNINYIRGKEGYSTPLDDGLTVNGQSDAEYRRELYLAATTSEQRRQVMRDAIERRFMVSHFIDYLLNANVQGNTDAFNKNWQWVTWDGVRWAPNTYDCDMAFGHHYIGNRVLEPKTSLIYSTPATLLVEYYMDDMKARYKQLRDKGVFDATAIARLLQDWCEAIGADWFEKEYEKWPESPCNRPACVDTAHWDAGSEPVNCEIAWSAARTFSKGGLAYVGQRVYMSLKSDNTGHEVTDSEWWQDITYDAEKQYAAGDVAAYGAASDSAYRFTCVAACKGCTPLTKLYTMVPREMGCHDSLERVYNYVAKRIESLDAVFDYNV